jgi:hypothetical protein
MNLRKSISLNEEYLKKIEPLIQKHNGNLSAVIREIIDLADVAFKDPDSVKRLILGLTNKRSLTSTTLIWALKNLAGRLPDEEVVHNIIGNDITSISSLEKHLNELMGEVYWDSSIKISPDEDRMPEKVSFIISGPNQDMNRFLAAVVAVFVSEKYNLGVISIRNENNSLDMNMKRGEKEEVLKSISDSFGYMDNAFFELYKKPDFWNMIITLYAKMNYDMVVIPKQLFEEILDGRTSHKITTCIEMFYGCPINQIPLEDLLKKIQDIYQYTGMIEKVDIDKDSLIMHHTFTEPEAIKKLAYMFVELLRMSGHTYNSITSRNLIVLKPVPRAGKIVIKMIDELKITEEPFENYHKDLLKMFDLLKNMPPNDEMIKSLGCEFGKMMIQNYEKDKKIGVWDTETFIGYMQETGVILKQNSKWETIGKNVIHGKIIACPLVKDDDKFNNLNCTFIKGMFDGWISHAFGEQIEILHSAPQTTTNGNGFCEIYVALRL